MPDPYGKIAAPPMPGAPGGLRYALNPPAGTNFLLMIPPCDPRQVVARRVMVSISGGPYIQYRANTRDMAVKLLLAANDTVAAYILDVNASGMPSARGPTATYTATMPETSSGGVTAEIGPPDDARGVNDDIWIDLESGNMYKKANGTWF